MSVPGRCRKNVPGSPSLIMWQEMCVLGNSRSQTVFLHRFWSGLTYFTYGIEKVGSSLRGRAPWLDTGTNVSATRRDGGSLDLGTRFLAMKLLY